MPNPRAFVSFDFDHDETARRLIVGQGNASSPTPFVIQDWSSKSSLPQSRWERIIAEKISRCHFTIVLVGRHMASASGVAKEIVFSHNADVPVFGIYVDGAGHLSSLPSGLARNRVITWTWAGVARATNQMMNEGKNR